MNLGLATDIFTVDPIQLHHSASPFRLRDVSAHQTVVLTSLRAESFRSIICIYYAVVYAAEVSFHMHQILLDTAKL